MAAHALGLGNVRDVYTVEERRSLEARFDAIESLWSHAGRLDALEYAMADVVVTLRCLFMSRRATTGATVKYRHTRVRVFVRAHPCNTRLPRASLCVSARPSC